jgi:photosystem II stability/assembly factor-like uncharacterized protein
MKRAAFLATLVVGLLLPTNAADAVGWVQQSHPTLPGGAHSLARVSFGDSRHGCVMGNVTASDTVHYAAVLTTSDGGATWTRRADIDIFDLNVADLQMVDSSHGWAIANNHAGAFGAIFSTEDGGATWQLRLITPRTVYALCFPDKDHGWVAGDPGALYATTDGGASWVDRSAGQPTWDVYDMDLADPLHGCLVGSEWNGAKEIHRAWVTANGGTTWQPLAQELSIAPYCVALRDADRGVVVGSGGIATIQGTTITTRYADSMDAVAFGDAQHVHAVGYRILASADGGVTWHEQESPGSASYGGVCFVDERHGWAVGSEQTIIGYDSAPPITTASGADSLWHNTGQTVHLSSVDDSDSSGVAGVHSVTHQTNAGSPAITLGDGADVVVLADGAHHATDGVNAISYYATDKLGNVEAAQTVSVRIDTRRPQTAAPARASARHGRTAALTYIITDQAPNGGKATVTIKIRNAHRRVARTLKLGLRRVNMIGKATFRCTLPAGRYRFSVYATDLAGNKQTRVGVNTLIVGSR